MPSEPWPVIYSCMLGKNTEWIVGMTRLAIRNAGGRTAVIPASPWKACRIAPGELTNIVPAMVKAGAAGIAIFNYQSLFSPRYSQFGYADEVRQLIRKP